MKQFNDQQEEVVFGISPLGGNSKEGTRPGFSPIRDTRIQGVPLFWDNRVALWISEQAVEELDDREIDLESALEFESERAWRRRVGYRTTVNPIIEDTGEIDTGGYGSGPYGADPYGDPA